MTLANSHHGRLHRSAGTKRSAFSRLPKRAGAVLKRIHRAIAGAKIRRLRRELMLHSRVSGDWMHEVDAERDVARIPWPPLVLGEKWDD